MASAAETISFFPQNKNTLVQKNKDREENFGVPVPFIYTYIIICVCVCSNSVHRPYSIFLLVARRYIRLTLFENVPTNITLYDVCTVYA